MPRCCAQLLERFSLQLRYYESWFVNRGVRKPRADGGVARGGSGLIRARCPTMTTRKGQCFVVVVEDTRACVECHAMILPDNNGKWWDQRTDKAYILHIVYWI
jgi:hypothetical protein